MPNYCSNAGTLTAQNERAGKLFSAILHYWENKEENPDWWKREDDDPNFCDFFIPRPDWKSIIEIPEGYYIQSGGWKDEKVWLAKEGEPNISLTDEQKEIIKEKCGGFIGDYDFCSNIWGTKWGLFDCEIWGDEGTLCFQGTTAWGPFTRMFEIFVGLNEELPDEEKILFSMVYDYSEGGCDFSGRQQIEVYDDGTQDIHDEEMGYEEGVHYWDGDHGTLEDPEDYWYNQKEWANPIHEGNNYSEIEDGSLVFYDGGVGIIFPSRNEFHVEGHMEEVKVHSNGNDFYIPEF